jgi:O-antigen biosynthesis protein
LSERRNNEETFICFDPQTGGLKIASHADANDYDLILDDQYSGVFIQPSKPLQTNRVNRICDPNFSKKELYWFTSGGAPVNKDTSANWTLDDSHTAYLSSVAHAGEAVVVASFRCPIEGSEIAISAGEIYTFCGLFGLHRTTGRVRLIFSDGAGTEVKSFESAISEAFLGGTRQEEFYHARLTVRAPVNATKLRIEIVKDITAVGADSYLFFSQPALCKSSESVAFERLANDLPDAMVIEFFRRPADLLYIYDSPIPCEAFDGGFHKIAIRCRKSGKLSNALQVAILDNMRCDATIFGLESSVLVAKVDLPPGWTNQVSVALWIDGQPSGVSSGVEAGTGIVRLPLPVSACDGRPHLFEIKLGLSGQSLGQHAAIGPVSTTPWDALQKYVGQPLPSQLSPVAAYRYASLSGHRADHTNRNGIDAQGLHDIIERGFVRERKEFRVLPFAKPRAPDVSIVIPVHNKFDVTYVCLAAILFAASKTSFEVIVVDDGSTDTTLRLIEIAPGVTYVRNETPLGFVEACNAGAKAAHGRYITFLNNDTEPTAHWLDELMFVFENFDNVGLAGSKLIYPDGRLQEAGGIVWETGDPWNYGRGSNALDPRYSYTRNCDYLSGAAIMIPNELWKQLGGFSSEFAPAYFEDTDLAFKVRNAGKRVVFAPHSIVVHCEGLSNGTDDVAVSGLKKYQEINRPKFKRKWSSLFAGNGKMGHNVDLAKDRGIAKRVVFFDYEFPQIDQDAGSYAAIQEIRMFQALGCKVTYVPLNMAFMARHTEYLQRIGVETIYRPFYSDVLSFLKARGTEFDLAYITRYGVAEQVLGPISQFASQARTVVNVADLHFLRAYREATVERNDQKLESALQIREAEVAALGRAELVLSYSTVEQVVISSHLLRGPQTGIIPWVVDPRPLTTPFADRQDIVFLGGFRHPPNTAAVKFFIGEVMPLLRQKLPGTRFLVYGSNVTAEIERLASEDVIIKGFVEDVDEVFSSCRVFVAPLLSGAGMKGKVLDCLAAGIPSVLSPVAAEGIDLRDGADMMIANRPEEWVAAIVHLYSSEKAWKAMSDNVRWLAATRYSFAAGVAALREALASIEFYLPATETALHVNSARPHLPSGRSGKSAKKFATVAATRTAPNLLS